MWLRYRYETVYERLVLPLVVGGACLGACLGGVAQVRSSDAPSLVSTAIVMTMCSFTGGTAGMVAAIMHPLAPAIVAVYGYHRLRQR